MKGSKCENGWKWLWGVARDFRQSKLVDSLLPQTTALVHIRLAHNSNQLVSEYFFLLLLSALSLSVSPAVAAPLHPSSSQLLFPLLHYSGIQECSFCSIPSRLLSASFFSHFRRMYNAVRRVPALARAFRTCAPRVSQTARVASTVTTSLQKPLPSALFSLRQIRSFQSSTLLKQANAAAAATQPQESFDSISEFSELGNQGYVHPRIIHSITQNMNINSMTDVQKQTISHSVTGADV